MTSADHPGAGTNGEGDRAERTLARHIGAADYDLPFGAELLDSVVRSIRRRRRMRVAAVVLPAAAAVTVAASLLPAAMSQQRDADQLSSAPAASPSASPSPPTSPTPLPNTGVRSEGDDSADGVAGWRVTAPSGLIAEPELSVYARWFGGSGITEDRVPGTQQWPVLVTMRLFQAGDAKKLWLSVQRPHDTGSQSVTDVASKLAAAQLTEAQAASYADVRTLPDVPAGTATLFSTNATNMIVQVASPRGDVVSVEATGLDEAAVTAAVRSLRFG